MIFVTVGTEKFPLDRLLRALDEGIRRSEIGEEVFAQTGHSRHVPKRFQYSTFLPFNEMITFIQKADIVVAHAGAGSTVLCLHLGKVPILFPRFARFGEHLDDHQVEFARQMEGQEKVLTAYDEEELIDKIKHYKGLLCTLGGKKTHSTKGRLLRSVERIIGGER